MTYRRLGHAEHDDQRYVPRGEIEAWAARDPIERFESLLIANAWSTTDALSALRHGIDAELDAAVAQVEGEPEAIGSDAVGGVYARE